MKGEKQAVTDGHNLASINKVLGDGLVEKILPADLEAFRARRKAEGRAPKTRDDQVKAAKKVVKKAYQNKKVSWDVLEVFEADKRECKRNSNGRKRVLTADEFQRLMSELPAHQKEIAATAFYTGMRKEEILGLTWDRVDLETRVIRLEAEHTKDAEGRNVPILGPLYAILAAIPKSQEHVFTYKGLQAL